MGLYVRARRGNRKVMPVSQSSSQSNFQFPCAVLVSHASYRLETVMKTSLLEHPHREPREHFLARAAANNFVNFPQLILPGKKAILGCVCLSGLVLFGTKKVIWANHVSSLLRKLPNVKIHGYQEFSTQQSNSLSIRAGMFCSV